MSYTELIFFDKNGEIVEIEEIKNAYLGAFTIWKRLFERYYPNKEWVKELHINLCKNVWKLCETHNLTKEELVCLFYTFDYALTDREHINILISSLKSYHEENDSLLEQAKIIENAFKNNKIEFIGTHQTTVSCSYWYDNNCVDEPKGWLIFEDKILKKKIEAKDEKNKLKGEKIKLKDYKGEYICYFNNFREIEIVDADDVDYIKELSSEGKIFYGTTKGKVFEDPYGDIKHMVEDNISNMGYPDMEDRIYYDTDEFKNLVSAYEKWIESLGADNNIYYQDENIIIEVEDESME